MGCSNTEGVPDPITGAGSPVISHPGRKNACAEDPTFEPDHLPITLHYWSTYVQAQGFRMGVRCPAHSPNNPNCWQLTTDYWQLASKYWQLVTICLFGCSPSSSRNLLPVNCEQRPAAFRDRFSAGPMCSHFPNPAFGTKPGLCFGTRFVCFYGMVWYGIVLYGSLVLPAPCHWLPHPDRRIMALGQ